MAVDAPHEWRGVPKICARSKQRATPRGPTAANRRRIPNTGSLRTSLLTLARTPPFFGLCFLPAAWRRFTYPWLASPYLCPTLPLARIPFFVADLFVFFQIEACAEGVLREDRDAPTKDNLRRSRAARGAPHCRPVGCVRVYLIWTAMRCSKQGDGNIPQHQDE